MIPLEDAIRKMTSAVAARLAIRDRGLLREGFQADVVIFDPETITDRATFEKPHQLSTGVRHVFVNGTAVVREGKHTGAKPGQIVREQDTCRAPPRSPGRLRATIAGPAALASPASRSMADAQCREGFDLSLRYRASARESVWGFVSVARGVAARFRSESTSAQSVRHAFCSSEITWTSPNDPTMTLEGLRSRWITPRAWE